MTVQGWAYLVGDHQGADSVVGVLGCGQVGHCELIIYFLPAGHLWPVDVALGLRQHQLSHWYGSRREEGKVAREGLEGGAEMG